MSTFTKSVIALAFVGAVFGTAAFFGLTPFGKQVVTQLIGSPSGTTFGTEKQASVVISLANPGANGTSTTLTNTDAYDRYISSWKVGCENVGTSKTAYTGAGLASLQISIGTTSSANSALPPGAAFWAPVAINVAVSTSTSNLLVASSTLQTATSSNAAVWHAGELLDVQFNATNTAACTVGVSYFGS